MLELFGERTTYEIAYGDRDLIEQLDTLPRRELVDRFETVLNEHQPGAAAAARAARLRPGPPGRLLCRARRRAPDRAAVRQLAEPHVLGYEMTKLVASRSRRGRSLRHSSPETRSSSSPRR